MLNPLVSVIVLTYNPSWPKLKPTLLSILCQQNINMELLLSDDGSPNNLQQESLALFQTHHFPHFRLLPHPENRGTVQNLISALREARGKYVYVISPGDFLFDESTLQKMAAFAEAQNAEICFGESVSYYIKPAAKPGAPVEPVLPPGRPLAPSRPELYNVPDLFRQKAAFFFLDYILGAAYLRRTETLLKYLKKIGPFVTYAEDTPTTLFALADGIPLWYFPEPVLWYDCGAGISTGKETRWQQILSAEYKISYEQLLKDHPNDPVLQAAFRYRYTKNEKEPVWKQVLIHPRVVAAFYRRRRFPVRLNAATEQNRLKLQKLLSQE